MDQEILSSLTAERLDELARREDETADALNEEIGGVELEHDYHRQIAAALRALAKAERAHVIIYPQTDEETGELDHWETRHPLRYGSAHVADSPTLLAALGSVGQQEKHDGNE